MTVLFFHYHLAKNWVIYTLMTCWNQKDMTLFQVCFCPTWVCIPQRPFPLKRAIRNVRRKLTNFWNRGHDSSTKMIKILCQSSDFVNIFWRYLLTFQRPLMWRKWWRKINTVNPLLTSFLPPHEGAYLFQACLRRCLFNLAKMIVSILCEN